MSNASVVCSSPSITEVDRVRLRTLIARRKLATVRVLPVAGGRPALSRCSVCAPYKRAGYMMIDGVLFLRTRMRPLVLLRLPGSGRSNPPGGSRGLPGAGRSLMVALAHRMFWALPSSVRTFLQSFVFPTKRLSQALLLTTTGSLIASSPSSLRVWCARRISLRAMERAARFVPMRSLFCR